MNVTGKDPKSLSSLVSILLDGSSKGEGIHVLPSRSFGMQMPSGVRSQQDGNCCGRTRLHAREFQKDGKEYGEAHESEKCNEMLQSRLLSNVSH